MVDDLRRYARQTQFRLIVGGLLILFIVGDGLIFLFFGSGAALMGLLCLGIGLMPLILIVIILWGMEWVVKNVNRE